MQPLLPLRSRPELLETSVFKVLAQSGLRHTGREYSSASEVGCGLAGWQLYL